MRAHIPSTRGSRMDLIPKFCSCFDLSEGLAPRACLYLSNLKFSKGWAGYSVGMYWIHFKENILATTAWGLWYITGKRKTVQETWEEKYGIRCSGEFLKVAPPPKKSCPPISLNLEGWHWAHAQKRPETALSPQLWLTFKFCTSRKWRLWQSCKLPADLKVCSHTHTRNTSAGTTGFYFLFQAFKKIFNHEVNIIVFWDHIWQVRTLQN